MKGLALITGETSGIGEAAALFPAENGFNLIFTERRRNLTVYTKKNIINNA